MRSRHIYGNKLTCLPKSSSPEYTKWRMLLLIKDDIILTKDQRICIYHMQELDFRISSQNAFNGINLGKTLHKYSDKSQHNDNLPRPTATLESITSSILFCNKTSSRRSNDFTNSSTSTNISKKRSNITINASNSLVDIMNTSTTSVPINKPIISTLSTSSSTNITRRIGSNKRSTRDVIDTLVDLVVPIKKKTRSGPQLGSDSINDITDNEISNNDISNNNISNINNL